MAYLDFDSLLICNQNFSQQFLSECFSFFSECGIRKFIFAYDFNFPYERAFLGQKRLKNLKLYLNTLKARSTKVDAVLNLSLSEGVAYHADLLKICCPNEQTLFLSIPIFDAQAWLDADLNHLLYRQKRTLCFTSFERNCTTNSRDLLDRLFRVSSAVFCVDAMYLCSLQMQPLLEYLLKNKVHIFPCISNQMSDYVGIREAFLHLKGRLPKNLYVSMCQNFRESGILLASYLKRGTSRLR